jgi:hypothetical protein
MMLESFSAVERIFAKIETATFDVKGGRVRFLAYMENASHAGPPAGMRNFRNRRRQ